MIYTRLHSKLNDYLHYLRTRRYFSVKPRFSEIFFPLLGTLLGNHSVDFPSLELIFQIGGRFFSFLSYFFTQQTSL